jgi:hypothetical protein
VWSAKLVAKTETHQIWPICLAARRGLLHPAFAWSGFSSAFVSIAVGQKLQVDLGTVDALLASIVGICLLYIYSAAIGFAAGRWGLNFQLMVGEVFARAGAILCTLTFAGFVAGRLGFHVALTTGSRLDTHSFTSRADGDAPGYAVRMRGRVRLVRERLRRFCVAFFDTVPWPQSPRDPRRSDLYSARWS